jgi:hypothetical protein
MKIHLYVCYLIFVPETINEDNLKHVITLSKVVFPDMYNDVFVDDPEGFKLTAQAYYIPKSVFKSCYLLMAKQ